LQFLVSDNFLFLSLLVVVIKQGLDPSFGKKVEPSHQQSHLTLTTTDIQKDNAGYSATSTHHASLSCPIRVPNRDTIHKVGRRRQPRQQHVSLSGSRGHFSLRLQRGRLAAIKPIHLTDQLPAEL